MRQQPFQGGPIINLRFWLNNSNADNNSNLMKKVHSFHKQECYDGPEKLT